MTKGKFITFEGSEGSGKSTQAALVEHYLKQQGIEVLVLREPGGVTISEAIRKILLDVANAGMSDECEMLLYMAARAQIVDEIIQPELEEGKVILCDRFLDSTIVYQGYGNGVDIDLIRKLGLYVTKGVAPDMTLLFDIDTEKGLSRTGDKKDRIELRSLDYHQRVRHGYLELAHQEPQRIKVIKVDGDKDAVFKKVKPLIDAVLERR